MPAAFPFVHVYADRDDLFRRSAEWLSERLRHVIAARGICRLALSGGSTPGGLFQQWTRPQPAQTVDWAQVMFFWSDERTVPPHHEDSNYRLAKLGLLDPLQIPDSQQFRLRGELPPAIAADLAEAELLRHFSVDPTSPTPSLDIVLLGLGGDSHTASLFPHTAALSERDRLIVSNYVPQLDSWRLTMTPRLINAARCIVFIAAGLDKAPAVEAVISGKPNEQQHPAQLICPTDGELHWFVDQAAASRLANAT